MAATIPVLPTPTWAAGCSSAFNRNAQRTAFYKCSLVYLLPMQQLTTVCSSPCIRSSIFGAIQSFPAGIFSFQVDGLGFAAQELRWGKRSNLALASQRQGDRSKHQTESQKKNIWERIQKEKALAVDKPTPEDTEI